MVFLSRVISSLISSTQVMGINMVALCEGLSVGQKAGLSGKDILEARARLRVSRSETGYGPTFSNDRMEKTHQATVYVSMLISCYWYWLVCWHGIHARRSAAEKLL